MQDALMKKKDGFDMFIALCRVNLMLGMTEVLFTEEQYNTLKEKLKHKGDLKIVERGKDYYIVKLIRRIKRNDIR